MTFNMQSFADRRAASADARKALLERFKARPKADDPSVVQRRGEREALASARARREVEKAGIRAEAQRLAAIEQVRLAEEESRQKLVREAAVKDEQARTAAERMHQVRLEAFHYMQMHSIRKKS